MREQHIEARHNLLGVLAVHGKDDGLADFLATLHTQPF